MTMKTDIIIWSDDEISGCGAKADAFKKQSSEFIGEMEGFLAILETD